MIPVDLTAISNVRERISAIQERMGLGSNVAGMDFENTLKKEMSKLQNTVKSTSNPPNVIENAKKNIQNIAKKTQSIAKETGNDALKDLIEGAAAKYNVDEKLLSAVAEVESGLNPNAISGAGAIGVMQLMPDTAADLGVDPYDTKQNIEGGAKYLRQMLDTFDGDVRKALAAYNAGPGAVKSYGGLPPYAETQNYVSSVLDIYK